MTGCDKHHEETTLATTKPHTILFNPDQWQADLHQDLVRQLEQGREDAWALRQGLFQGDDSTTIG